MLKSRTKKRWHGHGHGSCDTRGCDARLAPTFRHCLELPFTVLLDHLCCFDTSPQQHTISGNSILSGEWAIRAILSEKSKKIYMKSPLITVKQITAKELVKEYDEDVNAVDRNKKYYFVSLSAPCLMIGPSKCYFPRRS